jgi:hypothetical protein
MKTMLYSQSGILREGCVLHVSEEFHVTYT